MLTCHKCNAFFESRPEANAHYKSKWHEYNLMRSLNLLPPVSEASYDAAYKQLLSNQESAQVTESYKCAPCRKSFSSAGLYNSHLQSRRHVSTVASHVKENPGQTFTAADGGKQILPRLGEQTSDDESEWEDMADEFSEILEETNRERLDASIMSGEWPCLLCQQLCSSAVGALRHLWRQHSVVVPHPEACDVDSLYDALATMVLCQQRCLQCGRQHTSLRSCQRHMKQKPHLTLPLPGPYDFCYRWTELETSVILAATAASDCSASKDEYPPEKLQLPTGAIAAHRRSGKPRRSRPSVTTVVVKRRVVGAKQPHGGGTAVVVYPKKRRDLYGRKPSHAKRPIAKNLHKVALPC